MLRDMDDEMHTHLAMRVEYLRAGGMSEAEAEAEAMRRFGDTIEFRDYAARRIARGARWLRLTDWMAEWLQDVRFAKRQFGKARAFTAIAVIALVLAAIGLYGVIAYGGTQRTREIGVRVALGADPQAVTTLVVGGGFRLAVAGVVIGSGAAVAATRVLESMLYGVSPADPLTLVGIALLVAAIALVASYVPARRALRIDPTEALRAD